MSEFIWTDKLVAEYTTWKSKNGSVWINENIAKFKEYILKQQSKNNQDWEILSFKAKSNYGKEYENLYIKKDDGRFWHNNHPNHFDEQFCLSQLKEKKHFSEEIWSIHSVKVLSSGETFSLGDGCNGGKIKSFHISAGTNVMFADIDFGEKGCTEYLSKLKKSKPILFVTEDNVVIYEGQPFWYVNSHVWKVQCLAANEGNIEYAIKINKYKTHSTEQLANEFLLMNKPIFSLTEINDNYLGNLPFDNYSKFVELAKQKINQ